MIYNGDAAAILKTLPDESVHCCVTSPPYYGLRDYGVDGQIGLEETPDDYINRLVAVFREVKRVLRNDGTLWLNIADSYSGSGKGAAAYPENAKKYKQGTNKGTVGCIQTTKHFETGCKPKDLIGIPWMLAFALRSDGWYLRQDIIWAKPNPMPESVTDRCTKAHEYIFLLSKSKNYYYNQQLIKEPLAKSSHVRLAQDITNQKGSDRVPGKTNGTMKAVTFGGKKGREYTPDKNDPNFRNGSEQWGREYIPTADGMANKKSVWTVATQPYSEAHFATYPKELIRPCILAGCPAGGTVLDPFFGSGTTGEVSLEESRNYIGIELNPEYIKIAQKRISEVQVKMII